MSTPSGISGEPTAVLAKMALFEAARTALAADAKVDVFSGTPFPQVNPDYFAAFGGRSEMNPRDVGPRRQLDEEITLDVEIVGFSPLTGNEGETAAQTRAFGIYTAVVNHVRINDVTLGGLVNWCLPNDLQWDGATLEGESGSGSVCVIQATFLAMHRIR